MEKYSHFRDKATGIGPFFANPLGAKISTEGVSPASLVELLVAAVSAIVRAPLVAVLFGAVAIVPASPEVLYTGLVRPVLRLLVFLLGISSWDIQAEGTKKKDAIKYLPAPGSIIITNYVSPLDALVYETIFNSIFIIPKATIDTKSVVYNKVSLIRAVFAALGLPTVLSGPASSTSKSLEEYSREASASGKVVVVFGEGASSNGKGLLPLLLTEPVENATTGATYPTAIKYGRSSVATPTPTSAAAWLWRALYAFQYGFVRVRFGVPLEAGRQYGTATASGSSTPSSAGIPGLREKYAQANPSSVVNDGLSYKSLVSSGICRAGRLKEVGLGIAAKLEYVEMQKTTLNKKKTK